MSVIAPVFIGGIPVGDGHPTVFVAETGSFFNKDIEMAERYARAVAAAGAPIFKTEILHDPEVCLSGTGLETHFNHAHGHCVEDYRAYVERKILPLATYRRLFDLCHELGVPFIASVFDFRGVDFLAECGGAAMKLSRNNITNLPLIRHIARTGLPLIFDAGVVYLDEVARAVQWARDAGAKDVIVNHHPGANPAPGSVHHFRVMQTYREALQVPVGLSCHYRGEEMLYVAIGAGAHLLEKGIDDDPDRVEGDLISATRLSELPRIVRKVRECWESLGTAPARHKEPRDLTARCGVVAATAIAAGEKLTAANLRFAWPPLGVPVERWDEIIGRPATRALAAGQPVLWSDVRLD
jgi:sialic acid synthase SpsE